MIWRGIESSAKMLATEGRINMNEKLTIMAMNDEVNKHLHSAALGADDNMAVTGREDATEAVA